jgi:hypothetical protein
MLHVSSLGPVIRGNHFSSLTHSPRAVGEICEHVHSFFAEHQRAAGKGGHAMRLGVGAAAPRYSRKVVVFGLVNYVPSYYGLDSNLTLRF